MTDEELEEMYAWETLSDEALALFENSLGDDV
jgi:hypothetical protein